MTLPHRALGSSGLDVSVFALGCWRTYERISRAEGAAVLDAARDLGIDFLEAVRYDDETGRAPVTTGYSEIVFGEIFRRSGWPRDQVTIATKLWWEFWPRQDATDELEASLGRIGIEHVDLVYADPPPPEVGLDVVVSQIATLIGDGKARAWGVVNWQPQRLVEACAIARELGAPGPSVIQLAYSALTPNRVDNAEMAQAFASTGVGLIPSYLLAGGILTGRYESGDSGGRMPDEVEPSRLARAKPVVARLQQLAADWGTSASTIALAFGLQHPRTASVLFGATDPAQVRSNVEAAALLERLEPRSAATLAALGRRASA